MIPLNKRWLAAVALLGGTYYTFNHYQIEGWQNVRLLPKTTISQPVDPNQPSSFASNPWNTPATTENPQLGLADRLSLWVQGNTTPKNHFVGLSSSGNGAPSTIRVGSFNTQHYGATKIGKLATMESLAKICRQFDVLALQEISGREQDLLPVLVQKINLSGRRFDYLVGPRVGPEGNQLQFAFLFDTDRIETDRYQLYTVEDPSQLIAYEPLVAWFRTKTVGTEEAFTFSVVNVQIDEQRRDEELGLLTELLNSVRRDGRQEDDCLLVGDFGASDQQLLSLRSHGHVPALQGIPTNVRGNAMLDNILISQASTKEFTGRVGVLDFLREFNLTLDQAMEVSDHLPIWAEFTSNECGQEGRVAPITVQ